MEQQPKSVWQQLIDTVTAKIAQTDDPDVAAKWIEVLMRVADRHEREQERAQAALANQATANLPPTVQQAKTGR